jgi:hypothetical protein
VTVIDERDESWKKVGSKNILETLSARVQFDVGAVFPSLLYKIQTNGNFVKPLDKKRYLR